MDLNEAYRKCRELALSHYENFPVGSLLVPRNKRDAVHAVYAFARTADDIADSDKLTSEQKLYFLNKFKNNLESCFSGGSKYNTEWIYIFTALSDAKDKIGAPIDEYKALISAFRQDSVKSRYDRMTELIDYSVRSANPIGHLVLYTFGYTIDKDEKLFKYSDYVCTALQLTNFWQDVSVDLNIDRIYIPKEFLEKYTVTEEQLFAGKEDENFREMMKELVKKTNELFDEGKNITSMVKGRLKYELRATIAGGKMILNKIDEMSYNVLSSRPVLTKRDKLKILRQIILGI